MLKDSALGLIGDTPLVALDRVHATGARIYGKAEFLQPGGSVKDRAALRILRDAYVAVSDDEAQRWRALLAERE